MVNVRFTLTRSEFTSCHRHVQARRWQHWIFVSLGVFFGVLGILDSDPGLLIFGVLYAVVYAAGIWVLAPRIVWQRNREIRAEQAVNLSDAGIVAEWTNASTRSDWTFWRRVRLVGDVYMLQAKRRGFVLIPRHAFASPFDERRFRELVAAHTGAHLPELVVAEVKDS